MSDAKTYRPKEGARFTEGDLLEMMNVGAHVWGLSANGGIDHLSPALRAKFSAEPSVITQIDQEARYLAFRIAGVPPVIK